MKEIFSLSFSSFVQKEDVRVYEYMSITSKRTNVTNRTSATSSSSTITAEEEWKRIVCTGSGSISTFVENLDVSIHSIHFQLHRKNWKWKTLIRCKWREKNIGRRTCHCCILFGSEYCICLGQKNSCGRLLKILDAIPPHTESEE